MYIACSNSAIADHPFNIISPVDSAVPTLAVPTAAAIIIFVKLPLALTACDTPAMTDAAELYPHAIVPTSAMSMHQFTHFIATGCWST